MPVDFASKLHHDVYPSIDPKTTLRGVAEGKVIVLTGAGKGIGEAIAISFAYAGAKGIVLAARTEADLDRTGEHVKRISPKTQVVKVVTDVSKKESVENLFNVAFNRFSEIDVLVNNAGMLEPGKPVGETDIDTWCRTWDVNLKGTYLPTRYFLTQPSISGKTIINTTSVGALLLTHRLSGYQSSKTAIIRFTEFLNQEHGAQGLRTFAYHPGGVLTELAMNMDKSMLGVLVDKPELAGGYVVWLTTERADFLKGRYSSATWDVEEVVGRRKEIENGGLLRCGITGLNAGAAQ